MIWNQHLLYQIIDVWYHIRKLYLINNEKNDKIKLNHFFLQTAPHRCQELFLSSFLHFSSLWIVPVELCSRLSHNLTNIFKTVCLVKQNKENKFPVMSSMYLYSNRSWAITACVAFSSLYNWQLVLEPEWAIDSEATRARGIIASVKSD